MSLQIFKANGIKAIKDHVLVKGMVFTERLSIGGILIPGDDGRSSGIRPRWAEVIAVGPQQTDIQVGEFVLVTHGRWTREMTIDVKGEEIDLRRVDYNDIICASDVPMTDQTWSTAVAPVDNNHRIEGSMHNHEGGGLTG